MARPTRKRAPKKDSTKESVNFINAVTWNGDENYTESTSPRKQQHADSTSRTDSPPPNNYFEVEAEVPESPEPEIRQSSRRHLDSPSKQLAMEEELIRDSSPVVEADRSEEGEYEHEEEEDEQDDVVLKKDLDGGKEDESEEDDGDEENEADQDSSSDSDSSISESAMNDFSGEPVVVMPPLKIRSSESREPDERPQGTNESGESDDNESGDNENLVEESQALEENESRSGSEHNDSGDEQSEGEQETFEAPPQQQGTNRSGSENQNNGPRLRGNSRVTTVASRQPNLKRKGRPSLNERASKSQRIDGQTSHPASEDPFNSTGNGYVEWEYHMESESQPQRDIAVDADDQLFEEAIQVMGLERSWKRLISGCHELRTRESHIRPVFFGIESLRGHIFNMQELYKQMQEDQRTGSISVDLKDDLQNQAQLVRDKSMAILTKLVERANAANEGGDWNMKDEASTLAELILLDVFPELGDLAKECLKAYYSEFTLAEGGFVAVLEVLETMRILDGKIFSLKSCYRINILDYARDIRSALGNLWKRLDQGEFYARQQKPKPKTKPRQPASNQRPWTEDEEVAVIEGLKLYEGEAQRFQYLVEDFAAELGGRSETEVRKKANELYDDYLQAKNVSLTWLLED